MKKIIAVCGTWLYMQNPYQFIRKLNEETSKHGYLLACFSLNTDRDATPGELACEQQLIHLMENLELSALVVLVDSMQLNEVTDQVIAAGRHMQIPVIQINGTPLSGTVNLSMELSGGFEKIVRHVVEYHKCRNVRMMAGFKDNPFSVERVRIFEKVLTENGIPFHEEDLLYGDFWDIPARRAIETFLAEHLDLPDAFICANDSMALTVIDVLNEHGYQVPDDCIVTGFDGIIQAEEHDPILTTCAPDYSAFSKHILETIGQYDSSSGNLDAVQTTPPLPLYRQSCGCQRRDTYKWNSVISLLSNARRDGTLHINEMNRLVVSLLDKDSLSEMITVLPRCIQHWSRSYYCISAYSQLEFQKGQKENGNISELRPLLHSFHGKCDEVLFPFSLNDVLPDLPAILEEDSGINMLVFHTLRSKEKAYGFIAEGFDTPSLRDMERMEELHLFVSSSINTILNNSHIRKLSDRDYLTGLYNRRGFFHTIESCLALPASPGKWFNYFSIDMDGLKYINDHFGHDEGDTALIALAEAIAEYAGQNGIYARYGGDEFACAVLSDSPIHDISPIQTTITNALRNNPKLIGKPYTVAASIGVSSHCIDNTIQMESLMRQADEQMYIDKKRRKAERND